MLLEQDTTRSLQAMNLYSCRSKIRLFGYKINVLKNREVTVEKGEMKITTVQWITKIEIMQKNALEIVRKGRLRWKIENQGFNPQKNWQGDIILHAAGMKGN